MRSSVFSELVEAMKQAYFLQCSKNQNLEKTLRGSWLCKLNVSHVQSCRRTTTTFVFILTILKRMFKMFQFKRTMEVIFLQYI